MLRLIASPPLGYLGVKPAHLLRQMQERIDQAKVELNALAAQIRALKEAETQE